MRFSMSKSFVRYATLFSITLWPIGLAYGFLTSGRQETGSITATGQINNYPIIVLAGETVLLRLAETSESPTKPFTPRLELNALSGVPLAAHQGAAAANIRYPVLEDGTLNLRVLDGGPGGTGQGSYILHVVIAGKPTYLVMVGDEGGAVTSGQIRDGNITPGDLDTWSLAVTAGQNILVQVGETGSQTLAPRLRLFHPAGQELATAQGNAGAGLLYAVQTSGTYLVVVEDGLADFSGTGPYRIHAILSGQNTLIGDEGGQLWNHQDGSGSIAEGDLDPWTFEAEAGDAITLRLDSDSPGFVPRLRLFSPTGAFLGTATANPQGLLDFTAASKGKYLIAVGDGSSDVSGNGNYRVRVSGIKTLLGAVETPEGPCLLYPTPGEGTILQFSPSLNGTNWTEQVGALDTEGQTRFLLPAGHSQGYFRLAKTRDNPGGL